MRSSTFKRTWMWATVAVLALLAASSWRADAARITSVSPQGKVTQVRQVVVKFDEAMVAFGSPTATAPAQVHCNDAAASSGQARWIDDKTWAWDFAADLPPGVSCTVDLNDGLKSSAGHAVTGPHRYAFQTGGPFVQEIRPDPGEIEENQAFLLQLNGPATDASVHQHIWCESSGLGNRIPVKNLDDTARAALLKHFHLQKDAARILTLQCQQTLPAATKMQLVYGVGVAGPSGLANDVERRFDYTVREPFAASFSCERENAKAPCTPLRPVQVRFNAPINRADAEKLTLKGPGGTIAPTFKPDDKDSETSTVEFAAPLPEHAELTIDIPSGLKDVSGRALSNADLFPLKTSTAPMPPLAKFSSGTFGIVERFAEPGMPALVPVTLRNVEADLHVAGLNTGNAQFSKLRVDADTDIRKWMRLVDQFDGYSMNRSEIDSLMPGLLLHAKNPVYVPRSPDQSGDDDGSQKDPPIDIRSLSLLAGQHGVETLVLPKEDPKALRPFEVVGVPVTQPGFYVIELASPALGASLLSRKAPMYVRTAVLVTNLGVHFKQGRENSLVWVTSLDKGQPVPNATVQVSDCNGAPLADGKTDAHGLLTIEKALAPLKACEPGSFEGFFVSARVDDPKTGRDMAFVRSDWNRGIESWRFNVPTDTSIEPTLRAHTVFDRTLLRAGETVSMKHLIRVENLHGFAYPQKYPTRVTIRHLGSGQTYHLPLKWAADHSADSSFTIPVAAKLGEYSVTLDDGEPNAAASSTAANSFSDDSDSSNGDGDSDGDSAAPSMSYESGSFRVEEFRLPVFKGTIAVRDEKTHPLVAAKDAPLAVQIDYVSGGAASNLPVQVSALLKDTSPGFTDNFPDFSFTPYTPQTGDDTSASDDEDSDAQQPADDNARLIADKQPLTLDRNGSGALTLKSLPHVDAPKRLALEATFADPNGEVQTLSGSATLWPAAVVAGIKSGQWVSVGNSVPVKALAVDLQGKPRAGVALDVHGYARITTSSRKRMVGGFYAYDNHSETRDLGSLCSGKSDDHGLLACDAKLHDAGNIDLVVTAKDGDGNVSTASSSVWVTREDELWFGGENTDRIDVLPEKTAYEPGETARFQVRMPFRFATALVAVEREGILETHVVQLDGKDPTVELKVNEAWGPNVYVSVLALRGRIHEVPWYSFFTWGWKAPLEWARAFWYEGRQYEAPTPLVDLSKPAFRYGMAGIKVGTAAHKLAVTVTPDAKSYTVRGKAHVKLHVQMPGGKPAPAGTQIAVAAVDEALLELMPNDSWDVLDAMLEQRAYGVETSTAQMEIVGRRHFGRKAVPAGGGGGHSSTRELFDTLLLWNPRVTLDANGDAALDVPLNDALTSFRIVAIAAVGPGMFGTGSTSIRSTQDLQLISGLPPLVREGDVFRAQFTVRNTTARAMQVVVTPSVPGLALAAQTVDLAADSAREIAWSVTTPDGLADAPSSALTWNVAAAEQGGPHASDALKIAQRVTAAVPVTVQQATIAQVDGTLSLPVAAPPDASATLAGMVRGGIAVSLQSKLSDGLPGVRRWFERYPYNCLEQQTSRAIGLRDPAQWQAVVAKMPVYLDRDGLANYFPPSDDSRSQGSTTLTAYLLAVTDETARLDPRFALPDDVRGKLEAGLVGFVEGRIARDTWAPRKDLDLRKLEALEALSRYGMAQARMLDSIEIAPNQWPTSALLDYYAILSRVADIPQRDDKRAQLEQILRARLTYQGTRLTFSTEADDDLWWLMTSTEDNAARTALTFVDSPAWKDEMPRLVAGLLALQRNGAWQTTTSNVWGSLAVERFSEVFESTPVTGQTRLQLGTFDKSISWSQPAAPAASSATAITQTKDTRSQLLPWPPAANPAAAAPLTLTQDGTGKPWATIESLAAVPLKTPFAAGYRITKTVTPLDPAVKGVYTRGDVVRVHLDIDAQTDMTWVVVNDPVPAGATILGSGLGRDSEAATQGENSGDNADRGAWPAFVERGFDGYRAYYDYLPKGKFSVEYTVRLNNVGTFGLPPTRVEALYAPSTFGALPNAPLVVVPAAGTAPAASK
ncbi:Ig-like domain-containing alpha-2-macroglobulin family protein [Paraburkholderia sp. BCC1885]|uniref:Ig-like domain-containing alpha-2-macroglobulin family protein n=1 Tax=Paraburkholderia sp. BCC1885 TaxID=2562669 RepID=UPI001183C993|nr:Ig-like domain-containing alpha-2-macroglobulin family protein [Paraburkholderia sp. BCC1885]